MTKAYPLYYFHNRHSSDKKFVLDRMHYIPEARKDEVSNEYEKLYRSGADGRRLANTYLQEEAKKYYPKREKEHVNDNTETH